MKFSKTIVVSASVSAGIALVGGVAIAAVKTGAPATVYACITEPSRAVTGAYTSAANFKGCTNGFPVTIGGKPMTVTRVSTPEIVTFATPPANGELITETATCPAGTTLVGGGGIGYADAPGSNVRGSAPLTENAPVVPSNGNRPSTSWVAGVWASPAPTPTGPGGIATTNPGVQAFAFCAK